MAVLQFVLKIEQRQLDGGDKIEKIERLYDIGMRPYFFGPFNKRPVGICCHKNHGNPGDFRNKSCSLNTIDLPLDINIDQSYIGKIIPDGRNGIGAVIKYPCNKIALAGELKGNILCDDKF